MKCAALVLLASACAAQTAATGSVSGRVLDENHAPVAGAQVFRVAKRYDHGALKYSAAGGVFADGAGVYRLSGIPAGEVFVIETQNRSLQTAVEGETPADTFYPNALSPDLATEIVLNPGEARDGVDVHRVKLPTFCVEGSVDAAPVAALQLQVLDRVVSRQRGGDIDAVGKTNPDGSFRVCGLHRGQYLLMASAPSPGNGDFGFFAAATVNVADHDVRAVKLPHSSMSPFSAQFVWDGDESAQFPSIKGVLDLQARSAGFHSTFMVSGSFSRNLPLQPDHYAIDVMQGIDGPGQYIKEMECGGLSVLHGTAPLGEGMTCGTLHVVVARDGGTLGVRVEDKDGNPISAAYVAMIPDWAQTEGEMSALMTVGQTGPNGLYSKASLRPGKYRVLASTEIIDLAANRVDKLWLARLHGREVELGPNANVQIKVTIP